MPHAHGGGIEFDRDLTQEAAALQQAFEAGQTKLAKNVKAQQVATAEELLNVYEEATNPLASRSLTQQKTSLEENLKKVKKGEAALRKEQILPVREIQASAERFSKRNPELKAQILQLLLDRLKECKGKEDVRKLLESFYSDPTIADDAYDFLLEVTKGELNETVADAKSDHNQQFGREIAAGRNIASEVIKAESQALGPAKTLRDLYRDITGTHREPVALFLELSDRFLYKDLRKVLAFLFHSLGADLKATGPSIQSGLLFTLLNEVRSLQAILGVYQFFRARMHLINSLFQKNSLVAPSTLSFETLSKQFVMLLQDRYPSRDKILASAGRLGIEKWILAKIIVLSQLRDAIREVALHQLYRSVDHRNELYAAIIEALEKLEEELEELLEKEDREREGEEDEEEEEDKEKKEKKKPQPPKPTPPPAGAAARVQIGGIPPPATPPPKPPSTGAEPDARKADRQLKQKEQRL